MNRTRRLLDGVADAVAAGEDVDWPEIITRVDPAERSSIGVMRGLARLGQDASDVALAPWGRRLGEPRVAIGLWAVIVLAAAQQLGAILGFLSGDDGGAIPGTMQFGLMLAFLTVSAALLVGGRRDSRAVLLGGFYLLIACAFGQRFSTQFGSLLPPGLARWSLWHGVYLESFLPVFLWAFVREFPKTLRFHVLDRRSELLGRASLWAGLVLFAANAVLARTSNPELARWLSPLSRTHLNEVIFWGVITALTSAALIVAPLRARVAPPLERRRVRIFLGGIILGVAPLLVDLIAETVSPVVRQFMAEHPFELALVTYPFLLSIPFTTAYAVLVKQVLDVRLVVHATARYLLARFTLLSLMAVPVGLFAGYAYLQRELPIRVLLADWTARVLLGVATVSAFLMPVRRRLLDALDRHFAPRESDPAGAVARLTEQLQGARDQRDVARIVELALIRSLNVDHCTVFAATDRDGAFLPVRGIGVPLPNDSALAYLLREEPAPLDVSVESRRSCFHLLPGADRTWVLDGPVSVAVPVVESAGFFRVFITVGPTRSQLPFSRHDVAFLSAVAATTALAFESARLRTFTDVAGAPAALLESHVPAAECERCLAVLPHDARRCPCGGALRSAALPIELGGKFRVIQAIGRGGMGVVYHGLDLVLNRPVALKTLPRLSADLATRMRHEARAMAAVSHPNLALIFGAESWQGTPILVVELLEGGTLSHRLRTGPTGVAEMLRLGIALADALAALHDAGVLHRDVKPSNIGFSKAGVPKLMDFGVASLVESIGGGETRLRVSRAISPDARTTTLTLSKTHAIAGTPLYMSPEAVRGHAPEPSFDLWSVAVVLYESVAGRHPFRADTPDDVFGLVARPRAADLRRAVPQCPDPVAAFFERALHPQKDHRPRTARDFQRQLIGLLGD